MQESGKINLQKGMRQMGFFDNLKSSQAETGQDYHRRQKIRQRFPPEQI